MDAECEPDKPGPTCLASHGAVSLWPWGDMTYDTERRRGNCHMDGELFWYSADCCTANEATRC